MSRESDEPLILALSRRQLDAYNRADVDAFCACFHPEVRVLGADGAAVRDGMAAFRAAYSEMFARHRDVRATVSERVVLGEHVVERETGAEKRGEVLVRYSEEGGLIKWVQFLAPRAPGSAA